MVMIWDNKCIFWPIEMDIVGFISVNITTFVTSDFLKKIKLKLIINCWQESRLKIHNIKRLTLFAGDILQDCKKVFEDVHDDFCNVQNILLKFQQWREKFPDSYYEAFVGFCLPKLLSPLIRVQLLDWNPLKVSVLNRCLCWSCLLLVCPARQANYKMSQLQPGLMA